MDEQRQDDQLEPMYNSSVPIQEDLPVAIETDGGRWSGRSVLAARHDDDDNIQTQRPFDIMVRVFAHGPGDWGSY